LSLLSTFCEACDFSSDASGSRIADIFLDIVVFFKCYNDYVNKYEKATSALKNSDLLPLLQQGRVDLRNKNNQELSNLLIMPIQRLPRYEFEIDESGLD
jgi:hypothetical protein